MEEPGLVIDGVLGSRFLLFGQAGSAAVAPGCRAPYRSLGHHSTDNHSIQWAFQGPSSPGAAAVPEVKQQLLHAELGRKLDCEEAAGKLRLPKASPALTMKTYRNKIFPNKCSSY